MNQYIHLLYKNRFLQSNTFDLLQKSNQGNRIQFIINRLEFVSTTALTELNLVKAHRRFILRSFIMNKDLPKKNTEDFVLRGIILNKRKLFMVLTALHLLSKPEIHPLGSEEITLNFSNILLKLKQLDLYKANVKMLSDITVSAKLNDYNKRLINEIFST